MSTDAKKTPDNIVMMPDIYAEADSANESSIELVDQSIPDEKDSEGFNPYDTGRLQKHKIESADS